MREAGVDALIVERYARTPLCGVNAAGERNARIPFAASHFRRAVSDGPYGACRGSPYSVGRYGSTVLRIDGVRTEPAGSSSPARRRSSASARRAW